MLLILSLLLALIPLLGVAAIVYFGTVFTTDGLFMSLILLVISGIFAMNAALELRKGKMAFAGAAGGLAPGKKLALGGGATRERGRVESVDFYESHVGVPNTSIVTLSDGAGASRLLVVDGDARNVLPVGKTAQITYREQQGRKTLLAVDYN